MEIGPTAMHVHGLTAGPCPKWCSRDSRYGMPTDPVNHPAHYVTGGIEVIDAIEAWGLGFNLGNVVKYVARADRKGDALTDLEKAAWYLNREIGRRRAA